MWYIADEFFSSITYRVIFIYNRNNTHFRQGIKGIEQVFLFLLINVVGIEQYLCNRLAVILKKLIVKVHNAALSHS